MVFCPILVVILSQTSWLPVLLKILLFCGFSDFSISASKKIRETIFGVYTKWLRMDFPDSGEAEITNFEITVCVEENIGGLQVPAANKSQCCGISFDPHRIVFFGSE